MLAANNSSDSFGFMPERSMFMPIIVPIEPEPVQSTPKPPADIPRSVRQLLFESEREDLLVLSFKVIDCPYLFLKEDYIRAGAKLSLMVRYAVYAMGSAVAPPSHVPEGIVNRKEMALVFYEAASAHFASVISTPKEIGVLGLLMLSLAALKLERVREGLSFFTLTIKMAQDLGINKEATLTTLSQLDYERENMRGLWWCLYLLDRFLLERNCNNITDDMNQVFLPSFDKAPFDHSQDKLPDYGLQIMSSPEWYTPALPNQSLEAYRLLLWRIAGKTLNFNYLTKTQPNAHAIANPLFIMASLEGSLREWWRGLPEYILSHVNLGQSDAPIVDPAYTWRVMYSLVQFNHVKSLVYHPCLLKNTLESPILASKSKAFLESVETAKNNAQLLACYLRRNPQFEHCTTTVGTFMFHTAFPLVLALRMDLPANEYARCKESLDIHIRCLREHTNFYETVPVLCETLDYLISLTDPIEIVREFSRFKAMGGKTPTLVKYLAEAPGNSSNSSNNGTASNSTSQQREATESPQPWNMDSHSQMVMDTKMMMEAQMMKNALWAQSMPITHPLHSSLPTTSQPLDSSYIDMLLSSDPFFTQQHHRQG